MRDRGWVEFTVYPLFSPQSLIAEGTANYGIEVAFPGASASSSSGRCSSRPPASIPRAPPSTTKCRRWSTQLAYAGNEAARALPRRQDDGSARRRRSSRRTAMYAPERAKQRVRFIDQYRSYVINYNLGKDMVRRYIESRGGTAANPAKRWAEFDGAAVVAAAAVGTAVNAPVDVEARAGWRRRCSASPATSSSTRPAEPVRRFARTATATTSTCRRGSSTAIPRSSAVARRLLRRRVSRLHRDHPLAGHATLGERAPDRRRGPADAVLPRRTRPDEVEQPLARRLHALLPARGRHLAARSGRSPASSSCGGCCAATSAIASPRRRSARCCSAPASITTRPSTARTATPTRSSLSPRCCG